MHRNWLKGEIGDALHVIACAAGFNIKKLLRAIEALAIKPAFLRLLAAWQCFGRNACSSIATPHTTLLRAA